MFTTVVVQCPLTWWIGMEMIGIFSKRFLLFWIWVLVGCKFQTEINQTRNLQGIVGHPGHGPGAIRTISSCTFTDPLQLNSQWKMFRIFISFHTFFEAMKSQMRPRHVLYRGVLGRRKAPHFLVVDSTVGVLVYFQPLNYGALKRPVLLHHLLWFYIVCHTWWCLFGHRKQ